MDQSDIEQLTAIFAKLGYDISITKRKTKEADEKKEETKEPIIPQKAKTDEKKWKCIPYHNNDFKCVPIYMPTPINDKKCLCRLEKKGIPTQCTGIRLKGEKICTRHNKKMSGWGFYDDDEPPERTSDGKLISWNFATKRVAVEKKDEPKKDSGTTVMTAVKPKKDVTMKDMFGSDSDEEEDKKTPVKTLPPSLMHLHPSCLGSMSDEEEKDKKTPVKKMTNSKHEELMKCLDEKTSDEEDDESSSDEEDEYKSYGEDDDLKLKNIVIDGISYTYYSETKRLLNKEHECVGRWNGKCVEWDTEKCKKDHIYHPDYIRQTLIVGY